jgi:hypothetical protein
LKVSFPAKSTTSGREICREKEAFFSGTDRGEQVNVIAIQKPDATHVAGHRTWTSLGRFVRRGEKGIFILAPMAPC